MTPSLAIGSGTTSGASGWPAEIRATLALAWPLVLSNVAGTALTTIDVILLGRLGPETLAAAALGTNLYVAVLLAGIGLVTAVSPLIAAEFGRRRHAVREIRRTLRQGLWVAVLICGPAWIALWHGETILIAFGQEPALARAAGHYLRALEWALMPTFLGVVLRLFMAGLGRPGWGLAVSLAGLPVNLGLAWILIFGHLGLPALGLAGAGIATAASALLGLAALAAILVTDRRFRRYRVFGRFWRPDWPRFRSVWRIGLPIAATLVFEVAFFSASGLVMGTIGADALAAHTIALQISALCFMVPLGLAQAATIRVGHAFGGGRVEGVTRAGWSAFGLAMAFETATAATLLAIPHQLVGLFLEVDAPANAAVVVLAARYLGYAALFQLVDGAQVVGAGMLRGLADTRRPMLYAAFGYWGIGAPVGLLLAFAAGFGGAGLWIGLASGLAVVAVLMLARWLSRAHLGLLRNAGA